MNIVGIEAPAPKKAIMPSRRLGLARLILLTGIVALWAVPVTRPLDLPNWHEFDDAAMARNFIREPSSIFFPRIDWRRDGPGFVESEFPLYPWLVSQCYRVGGVNVIYGRIIALLAMIGALLFFTLLARSLLPEVGALTAVLLFGTNRIVNFVSTALQPEAFMLFFYLAAIYGFLQWRAHRSWRTYTWTILAVSLAILEKSPAAHLGIFFLLVLFWEEGWAFLKSFSNWCFAVLSLILPFLWYAHAYRLWTAYGNSLGISNENHWIGWDILRNLSRPLGLAMIEALFVFAVGGILLACLGALNWRSRTVKLLFLWFASIALYYVLAIRTTGSLWAWYYHVVSVAPAALLCGAGVARVLNGSCRFRELVSGAAISAFSLWLLLQNIGQLKHGPGSSLVSALTLAKYSPLQNLALVTFCIVAVLLLAWLRLDGASRPTAKAAPVSAFVCAAGISGYLFVSGHMIASDRALYDSPSPEMLCANEFRPAIPEGALILTSGGICGDSSGHKAASDAPHMFYWLDRKGFSMCIGEQSLQKVLSFSDRGASYFVAEKIPVRSQPGFEIALKSHFTLISECSAAWLFDLRRPSH